MNSVIPSTIPSRMASAMDCAFMLRYLGRIDSRLRPLTIFRAPNPMLLSAG